mgnify:CR=1 FL=1
MSLFKKKNKKKKPQFYDENLNIELEYEDLKKNSLTGYGTGKKNTAEE